MGDAYTSDTEVYHAGKTARLGIFPLGCTQSMPAGATPDDGFFVRKPVCVAQRGMALAQSNELGAKTKKPLVCSIPVQPGRGVILAIGIVVAALRIAPFVTGQQLGNALGNKQGAEQGAAPFSPQCVHFRVGARALHTAVGTEVVVVTVAIVLPIGGVVLVAIRCQIGQRHAVMGRNKVDACQGAAPLMLKQVAGTGEAANEATPGGAMA